MSLTKLSIKRPVATSMFYLAIIVVGLVGYSYLPIDLLPRIEFTRLTVFTSYPNVGPEEIETIITDPVENALAGVPNIERVTSSSEEGRSRVSLEFAQGTDLAEATNDVRDALDRLRAQLPEEADPPRIFKFDPNTRAIVTVAANSRYHLEDLTRILERDITQRFERIPGVGSIELRGGIYREIRIDLDRDRLSASGLTADDVRAAIAQENSTLPGGNVKSGISDLYVRTRGEYTSVEQIAQTVVQTVNGRPIRVQDVARVNDSYEDVFGMVELDQIPSVRFQIQKQSGANTVAVAEAIRQEVDLINRERTDLQLMVISDQSTFIEQSIDNVKSAALWGSLLALIVLYLFLRNGSTTFIISLAIPISIVATFGLLYFSDLTLNQMTFGGLALGIGMIVDNAIVVLENIVRRREEFGESLMESASNGTRQVTGAIVASTLTTSVIFLPLAFAQTTSATLFQALALVVVFSLLCSLFVALSLVPMLASRFLSVRPANEENPDSKAPRKPSRLKALMDRTERRYSRAIGQALARRWIVYGTTLVLLIAAGFFWTRIPVELAPQTDADEIDVSLEMGEGTNIAVVLAYLKEMEEIVRGVLPMDQVQNVATEVRNDDAEIEITLLPAEFRTVGSTELADELREAVEGQIPGARVRVRAQSGLWILRRIFSSGDGDESIQIELRGYDQEIAYDLAQQIQNRLGGIPGIHDTRLSMREGRPEQNLVFDREKISDLGMSVRQIAQAIQTNVGGSRAGQFRVGGEEFPIVVRLQPEDRLTSLDLESIGVRTPDGAVIPVSAVTNRESGRGPTEIDRINGQRVTYISANLEGGIALGDAVDLVREDLASLPLPEGFSIVFGGEYLEQEKAKKDFILAIVMAIILIYMVMAGQFERFLDPLIVMFSVPLALIGVVPMLILTGDTLNMQSIMGVVMLIGIVVNNAIVLVDYINLLRREEGMSLVDAVQEAGRLRLRPILMTALTTVLGLVPLAIGLGAGAEIQASLARVVIGGLVASTFISLIFIPVVYVSVDRWSERVTARVRSINWLPSRLRIGTEPSS